MIQRKILGIDLGDKWHGIALSDQLGLFAKPHTTIPAESLLSFLHNIISQEYIITIVIGYPRTLRGTESAQTKSVIQQKEILEKQFPQIQWILWDERLSSQRAERLKNPKTKQEKLQSHAVAAAFILQSYLDSKSI